MRARGITCEKGEAIRSALNDFIRTSKVFDAVADFDAATRDPQSPKKIRAEFDPGDHLHPNDKGYEAMANAIDLAIFNGKKGQMNRREFLGGDGAGRRRPSRRRRPRRPRLVRQADAMGAVDARGGRPGEVRSRSSGWTTSSGRIRTRRV